MAGSTSLAETDREEGGLGHPLPIRLSRITRYENQPRRYFDEAGLEALADSIQAKGQKTPVRVCKHSRQPGVFVLIGGERRWRAFHRIQERTGKEPLVNAFVDTVNDERHHFEEALLDNLQREDLVSVDEASAYKRLYDESDKTLSHSAKVRRIADLVKKSPSHVENYLCIDSLPFPVKKLMDPARKRDQQLSITAAIEIAKSTKNPQLQLKIAQEAIERSLGIDETRMLISMRTGNSGLGVGGHMRRPGDAYRSYRTFLNSTLAKLRRFQAADADLDDLYANREDEDDDRKEDAATLALIVKGFENLRKQVTESDE